ncbi:MAG: ferritin family protein [Fibrobacterales bacterium]
MDIFEFALKMEKDGELFYRDLAEKSTTPGFKKIFTMLADEEIEHYRIIKELQNKVSVPSKPKDSLADEAQNVFETIKKSDELFGLNKKQKELYYNAAKVEDEAADFYTKQAEETEDSDLKMLFSALADEEKKHSRLLEDIGDFVGAPDHWDVDAESTNPREEF